MDFVSIARALGAVCVAIGAAALAMCVLALAIGPREIVIGFAIAAAVGLFLGGALRFAVLSRPGSGGAREALITTLAGWVLAPVIAAPPFVFSAAGPSPFRAFADALSAATTTGLRPGFLDGGGEPILIAWWNLLQWLGGGASIVVALVVLSALNLTGPGVHRSVLFTLEPERLFARIGPVSRATGALYGSATAVVFLLALIGGGGPGDSLALAMASVSTGGLLLTDGTTVAAGVPGAALAAASLGLLFGALNFALHWDAVRGRAWRSYFQDGETKAFFGFVAVLFLIAFLAGPAGGPWGGGIVGSLSLAATAPWDMGNAGAGALPAPLMIAVVLVGGSAISTAGGLKIIRLILLLRYAEAELRRLAHPSSVAELRFRGHLLPNRRMLSLLVYAIGFAGALGGLTLGLAASGAGLEDAVTAAAAALSNAGGLVRMAAGGADSVIEQSDAALAVMCFGMVLGRVEVLAALAVVTPGFWRS